LNYITQKPQNRTLLYLASGPYKHVYENLPYEKIILVDKSTTYHNFMSAINSKVELWNMDALNAVDEIAKRKLVINCIVSVNEGLNEGGGDYVIFSELTQHLTLTDT
jgi:hypothetical protein